MWVGHAFEVCERISEAQAILHDQVEGAISPDAALAKLRALLSEPGLQEAMYILGYFPKKAIAPGSERELPQHTAS
jgi:hypothetical protein